MFSLLSKEMKDSSDKKNESNRNKNSLTIIPSFNIDNEIE
jgi:hypothetical protein